jgi:restriction system protein
MVTTLMGRGRRLRRRFRDDSTLAALMEVPKWLFLGILTLGAILAFVAVVVIDAAMGRPNLVLAFVAPLLLVAYFVGLFWVASRERLLRRRRLQQASSMHRLLALQPDDMADMATELFRLEGYFVTENKRPDEADGGVDFEISKAGKTWLVQVKHWRHEVGVDKARELWGLVADEGAAGGVLVGTSGFTAPAREFADGKDLRLIDGPEFLGLRSQLPTIGPPDLNDFDPLVSVGFARYLSTIQPPACPTCGKPMILVTRLENTAIGYQLWGCKAYPNCKGTRRFAFPYVPSEGSDSGTKTGAPNW